MPLLAALGIPLRERLVWVLGLIAVYVPLAGAGPSIQRAGVMGALGRAGDAGGPARVAPLRAGAGRGPHAGDRPARRRRRRLAAQLRRGASGSSCSPRRCARRSRRGSARGGWRRALAEGAAVTIAATLATAPLIAFHFGTVSTTTLVANLLAMPAVAPAMWLGMLAAAAGQVPGFPVEALNALNALLLGYIAQVAAWCGRPSWAYLHVRSGAAGLVGSYLALGRRRSRRDPAGAPPPARRLREAPPADRPSGGPNAARRRRGVGRLALASLRSSPWRLLGGAGGGSGGAGGAAVPACGSRCSTSARATRSCCSPRGAPAVLVDGGPPGDGLAAKLRAAGVERLGAAVVTHDQSDHAGGIEELLGRIPVAGSLYARAGPAACSARRGPPAPPRPAGRGRRAALRRPAPRGPLAAARAACRAARAATIPTSWPWSSSPAGVDFSMLLTADAEAEAVPIDPGPIDVLKVAHHGSDDAGLGALLDRTAPKLAVISVGAGNPYGHPTPATLATLAAHGVRTLRTDRDGDVVLEVDRDSIEVDTGG